MAREGPAAPSSRPVDEAQRRARAYWRHQLVLTLVAAAVVLAALIVVAVVVLTPPTGTPVGQLRLGADGRVEVVHPADDAFASRTWPAVAGAGAVTTVLGALVIHTVRVATFTFRRGDR